MQTWVKHPRGYAPGPSSNPPDEGGAEAAAPPLAPLRPTFGRVVTLMPLRLVAVGVA